MHAVLPLGCVAFSSSYFELVKQFPSSFRIVPNGCQMCSLTLLFAVFFFFCDVEHIFLGVISQASVCGKTMHDSTHGSGWV